MNQEPPDVHSGAERPLTDTDIAAVVQLAQNGEAAAFGQLYELYSDRVFRYVAYRVDSNADAEDITEDVFIRMLEAISSFKWREVPFSAWLMRVAHNRVIDHYRRGRLRTATPLDDAPPLPSRDRDPQERVGMFSDLQELRVAMGGLTDLQRQVISLRFGSELSIAETAKAMDRNEGAVKALQHSAIQSVATPDAVTGRAKRGRFMSMQPPQDDPILSEAIDECLEALRQGQTIDDCLSRYPDIAVELRPLLLTASAAAGVSPERDDAARRVGRFRFEGAVQHHLASHERASGRWSLSGLWNRRTSRWSQAWAAGLATMALAVILSTGAAYASTDAMPDSPLYPVKRVTERARLVMTFSDGSRALYHLELIERRTIELAAVAESGATDRVEQLSRDVLKNIEFARVEAGYTGADTTTAADDSDIPSVFGAPLSPADAVEAFPLGAQPGPVSETAGEGAVRIRADEIEEPSLNARDLAYIEAERHTAERAYAMLHIAHQLAPSNVQEHVTNALTLAEQRYRRTRFEGEAAPISRDAFRAGNRSH